MSIYVGPEEIHTIETLRSGLHCPRCTARFAESGLSSAFWQADETVYFSWCHECGWFGDIIEISSVVSYERAGSAGQGQFD